MASTFQLFLRGLDGRTSCLRFPSPIVTGSLIQEQIAACLRLPAASLLISTGTALVHPQTSLSADANGFFPSCSLSARLRGGKGGFGSLLRGAATKAGQKKTSNFDACRDMSGRRLRHVNAEKKLKEWKSQAKDRELEKAAREFLKKQTKRKEDDTGSSQLIEKFREETSKARENVESAVASGLAEARKLGKRKIADDDALPTSSSKQARLWYESNFDVIDDNLEIATDSSDDDDDNEKSFEVIDANEGIGCREGEETFEAESDLENRDSEGLSPQGKIEDAIEQSETRNSQEINDTAIVQNQCDLKLMCDNNVDTVAGGGKFENTAEETLTEETLSECHGNGDTTTESLKSVGDSLPSNGSSVIDDVELYKAIGKKDQEICASLGPTKDSVLLLNTIEQIQKTFSLDNFLHASDLEVLGLDRLKSELQTRGLKCGGSLSDRAGRLFLLKATPLEKLDKKHFAKARC